MRGVHAHFGASVSSIVEDLSRHGREGDLIVVMSNGGFGGIHQLILDRLSVLSPE